MHKTTQQIINTRLLPLFYNDDYETCLNNILACNEAGIKVFEFTNRGKLAMENFRKLKKDAGINQGDFKLGVGTIYTDEEAKSFLDLGADFIVQPVCTESVALICQKVDIPWIPGTMTLNEIYHAYQLGAELIKVFPANTLGTSYIKNIRGPLPQANIMVTGGIEAEASEIKDWLKAGAKVCGLGSQLFNYSPTEIKNKLSQIVIEL